MHATYINKSRSVVFAGNSLGLLGVDVACKTYHDNLINIQIKFGLRSLILLLELSANFSVGNYDNNYLSFKLRAFERTKGGLHIEAYR
jgi:hypothetical protein